jgi:large subunit ribosomal protein L13
MIIDGTDLIIGRVLSRVAKAALFGEDVAMVNCEKLIMTGSWDAVIARQRLLSTLRGKPTQGRFYERRPDFFVEKMVRGMLPKNARGSDALNRIRFYIGVPDKFKDQKTETFEKDNVRKVPHLKYTRVADICQHMGTTWQQK